MKLKYFYRIDQKGKPITASNIRRKSVPFNGKWKELKNICCDPQVFPCTCEPRFFVQLDKKGNPIDHTIIKREMRPQAEEGTHFMEVDWENPCCI